MKHAKVFRPADTQKCGSKNCYNSQEEAEQVKQEQELRDLQNELKLGVYRCQYCSKFHLTQIKES